MMKRILFVCLGNICRSAAADGIMRQLVAEEGLSDEIEIDSAGTYSGHQGQLPDARMRKHALRRGYELTHRARPVRSYDFDRFDLIIAMDDNNYYDLQGMARTVEDQKKIHRMREYLTDRNVSYIPDPYYSGAEGFELVLDLLEDGCRNLLKRLQG